MSDWQAAHELLNASILTPCMQIFTAKLEEFQKRYGLDDKAKVREEAIFDMYKKHITTLREQVRKGAWENKGEGVKVHIK